MIRRYQVILEEVFKGERKMGKTKKVKSSDKMNTLSKAKPEIVINPDDNSYGSMMSSG